MSHSITPATQDGGRSVADRAWLFCTPGAVVARDFSTKATEVLVFDVRAEWLGRRHSAFDQWHDNDGQPRHLEALFQLFLTGVADLTGVYLGVNSELLANPKCPIRVFLEAVLADEAYVRRQPKNDPEAEARIYCAKQLEQTYYGTVTADQLLNNNMGGVQPGSVQHAALQRVRFMTGESHRKVTSYRIWVMINEQTLRLSEAICRVYERVFTEQLERVIPRPAKDGPGGAAARRRAAAAAEEDKSGPINVVKADERYKLINEPMHLLIASSAYLNDKKLLEKGAEYALAARLPIKNAENEINPGRVFAVRRHFQDCAARRGDIDARQRTLEKYYDSATQTWSFVRARPHCVLVVNADGWMKRRLLHMYTPDYQLRHIEPHLSWTGIAHPLGAAPVLAVEAPAAPAPPEPIGGSAEEDSDDDCSLHILPLDPAQRPTPAELVNGVRNQPRADEADGDDSSAELAAIEARESERRGVWRGRAAAAAPAEAPVPVPEPPNPALEEERRRLNEEIHMMSMTMGFQDHKVQQRAIDLASNGTLGGTQATVLHEMRSRYFLHELPTIEAIEDVELRTRERLKMSMRAIDEYVDKASSPYANVSQPHQAMNSWATEQRKLDQLRFKRKTKFRDPRLSFFAQYVMQIYQDAEELCAMHTAHDVLFLLYVSSRSALMYDRDTLRNNVLLYGEHATSKSYPLTELCKKMLITGTYISVTSQSRQAGMTDTHTNDLVCIHEELQQGLISRHSKDGEMQDAFKDMLTRGASSRLICFLAASGKRETQVSQSEKNMVVFGACNLREEDLNPAIASRMLCMQQVPRNRQGHSFAQTQASAHAARNSKRVPTHTMQHDYYLRQVIHNDVEKLIMIGALEQPHLECFAPIYMHYENVLKREYSISVERRQTDQLRMMLRSLIIMSAIEWLYNSPAGPCYGMAYSVHHLPMIEPMLHDTEELVYFALDLCRYTLINPNHEALIDFLRTNWVPSRMVDDIPALAEPYMRRAHGGTGSAAKRTAPELVSKPVLDVLADKLCSAYEQSVGITTQARIERFFTHKVANATEGGVNRIAQTLADVAQKAAAAAAGSNTLLTPDGRPDGPREQAAAAAAAGKGIKRTDVLDWNYVSLGLAIRPLASKLAQMMKASSFRRAMGEFTIENALRELSTHGTVLARHYRKTADDEWPPVEPSAAGGLVRSEQIRTGGDGILLLHSSLAFFERGSPHEAAIMQCMNRYTPAGFFIAGRPVSDQVPHLAHVRRTAQTPRCPEVFIGKRLMSLEMSYNEYSTGMRLEYLGIQLTDDAYNTYDPAIASEYAKTLPGALDPNRITYPDDLIKADLDDIKRNLDVAAMNAAGVRCDSKGNRLTGIQRKRAAPRPGKPVAAIANFEAACYTGRRVYGDGDVNTLGQTAMYDGEKLRNVDLTEHDDPFVVPAAKKRAVSVGVPMDADDNAAAARRKQTSAIKPRVLPEDDATLNEFEDAPPPSTLEADYERAVDQARWAEQGNRPVIIPPSHSNMAADDYESDHDDDDEPRVLTVEMLERLRHSILGRSPE